MAKGILSSMNEKCSATYGEKKAMPLNHVHKGHMNSTGTEPGNYKFGNTKQGKTRQDYGNFYTQAIKLK